MKSLPGLRLFIYTYIRETGRSPERIVTKYKYAVKTGNRKNGVMYGLDQGHSTDREGVKILECE